MMTILTILACVLVLLAFVLAFIGYALLRTVRVLDNLEDVTDDGERITPEQAMERVGGITRVRSERLDAERLSNVQVERHRPIVEPDEEGPWPYARRASLFDDESGPELPGMWDQSDLSGGWADNEAERGGTHALRPVTDDPTGIGPEWEDEPR